MKVGRHFYRREFECGCGCGFDTVDVELVDVLDHISDIFGKAVITSGARCESHNRSVGGVENSQHRLGRAADFVCPDTSIKSLQLYLIQVYEGIYGIGCYDDFTHIDTRSGGPARW